MRLVLNFSFLGAVLAALIYYYGKTYSDQQVNWKDKQNNYIQGFQFFLINVFFAALAAGTVGLFFSVLTLSDALIWILASTLLVFITTFKWRNKGKELLEKEHINTGRETVKIWFYCFLSFLPLGIAYFHMDWPILVSLGLMALPATAVSANLLGKVESDEKEVKVKTEDEEFLGELFRVDNKFFYFWTVGRVKMVNQDSVVSMESLPQLKTDEKEILFDSTGYTGSFVKNKVYLDEENWEDSLNWIKHYRFEKFSEKDIDLCVVHHGDQNINVEKQNEVFRKIIDSLADELDVSKVEDQVKQRYFKEADSSEDEEYLTVSFREHSEEPLKLVNKPSFQSI